MNKFILGFLITLIFLSSCGTAGSIKPIPQPLASPSDSWDVKLTQSGGIAGVLRTIEVSSDGQLKAEDQRSQRSVTKILPSQTTAELKGLIFNTVVSTSRILQSACADCFIYDLEIQSDGNDVKIHVDDATINDSSAQGLITTLLKIRDEALNSNP
jgi:hypothetical protein